MFAFPIVRRPDEVIPNFDEIARKGPCEALTIVSGERSGNGTNNVGGLAGITNAQICGIGLIVTLNDVARQRGDLRAAIV